MFGNETEFKLLKCYPTSLLRFQNSPHCVPVISGNTLLMVLYTLLKTGDEDILTLNWLLLRTAVAFCHCLIHRPPYTNATETNLKHTKLIDAFQT